MMFAVHFGLSAAMLFGLVAYGVYDTAGVMMHGWFDILFWSLIHIGVGVSVIGTLGRRLSCRIFKVVHVERLETPLRRDAPFHR